MAGTDASVLLIGTYTETMPHVAGKGAGINLVRFDETTGRFGEVSSVAGVRNPSYLTVSGAGDRVYCVSEIDQAEHPTVETFSFDASTLRLLHLASELVNGSWPCHVSLNEEARHLYVSNYASGNCSIFALDDTGRPHHEVVVQRSGSGPHLDRQEASHAHCAIASPDGRHLYLCDLGTDKIARHPITDGQVASRHDIELVATPGAGPRHVVFTPSGQSLLGIHELSSTISLYRIAGDEAEEITAISTLPSGWEGTSGTAAIRIHPSGRYIYASNRGHDSVFVAELDEEAGCLTTIGHWPVDGRTPRDIALTPNGQFLLAASQDDHRITVFHVEDDGARLSDTGTRLVVNSPVCLCFAPAEASTR